MLLDNHGSHLRVGERATKDKSANHTRRPLSTLFLLSTDAIHLAFTVSTVSFCFCYFFIEVFALYLYCHTFLIETNIHILQSTTYPF